MFLIDLLSSFGIEEKNKIRDIFKRMGWAVFFLGLSLAPLSMILSLGLFFFLVTIHTNEGERRFSDNKIYMGYFVAIIFFTLLVLFGTKELEISLLNWLFGIDRYRLLLTSSATLYIGIYKELMFTTMADWIEKDEKEKILNSVKPGYFDYKDWRHLFVLGTTGAGKTTMLLHKINDAVENGVPVFIISGKIGVNEEGSLTDNVKKICDSLNVPLNIVSTSSAEKDRVGYNPFKYMDPETVKDCLVSSLEFSEPYYKTAFSTLVLKISQLLRYANKSITFDNIMRLYSYDKYEAFADLLLKKNYIDKTTYERFMDGAEDTAKVAKDSGDRLREYIIGDNSRDILCGADLSSIMDVKNNNGVFLLDLDGPNLPELSKMLATWALADIANMLTNSNVKQKSLLVLDELSFYYNDKVNSLYATARSKGMQIVSATQSFSDLDAVDPTYTNRVVANSQQFVFMKLGLKEDIERACNQMSTKVSSEVTRRTNGIDYDEAGSIKAIHEFEVHPEYFKYMKDLESVYVRKQGTDNSICAVKWAYFEVSSINSIFSGFRYD